MASGRPFIASEVPGVREQVSGAGLLFPDGNPAVLAQMLRKVCEDTSLGNAVAAKCLSWASKFSLESSVRRYLREYELIKCN